MVRQDLAVVESALWKLLAMSPAEWSSHDVRMARTLLGLSQEAFAELIGYTRQGIGKIEAADTPPERVVVLAARGLLIELRFAVWLDMLAEWDKAEPVLTDPDDQEMALRDIGQAARDLRELLVHQQPVKIEGHFG